jgi:DNA-damage-inducible protein J
MFKYIIIRNKFNAFFKQVELQGEMPFEVKIPNKETLQAIKEAKAGINVVEFNIEDFKR